MWFVKTWTMTSLTSQKGESVATKKCTLKMQRWLSWQRGQLWPRKMWDSGSDTFVIAIPWWFCLFLFLLTLASVWQTSMHTILSQDTPRSATQCSRHAECFVLQDQQISKDESWFRYQKTLTKLNSECWPVAICNLRSLFSTSALVPSVPEGFLTKWSGYSATLVHSCAKRPGRM